MLGWVQKVLPQPPGTPQKTKEEEKEDGAEAQPEPEPQQEPEPESDTAPEEAMPEDESLLPEEPVEGAGVAETDPSLREVQEVAPPQPTTLQAQVAVAAKMNSPSAWVLTWFWKRMEKVVPQPACSKGAQNPAAGVEDPPQAGAQSSGPCGTGDPDGTNEDPRVQDTGSSPWLLRWLEENLEKVLPQPPKPSEAWKADEPTDTVLDPEPPGSPEELEPTETPSLPSPGTSEPEEEPVVEPQSDFQASSLPPPPGDPARLIAWLLHKLKMALPQPVLHAKAEEEESGCPETCDVQTRVAAAGSL